ncbi:zinc finger protein 271 [Aplysia californica]|uniref:Zinc finger protein 271 n=1 Tax=Aplysia californica TaxID=6500 RepID=A0ABM0JUC6_APLCA|nr:zinc finger protein 271 [Aplysia californica]
MAEDCMLGGLDLVSPLAVAGLPGHEPCTSSVDFAIKLEKVAGLFLELLQESKIKLLDTPLSAISLICDVAKFMQRENDISLLCSSLDTKEQATQTRLVFQDIEILYTKAQQCKSTQNDFTATDRKDGNPDTIGDTSGKVAYNNNKSRKLNKSVFDDDFYDVEDEGSQITNTSIIKSDICDDYVLEPSVAEDQSKEFKCSYCSKVFIDRRNLKSHLWIHEKEKSYECSICGKKFLRPHQLTRHKRVHTGEKPYKCSVCSRAFGDVSNLNAHMRKEHPKEAFSRQCDMCGQRCPSSEELEEHIKAHHAEETEQKEKLGPRTRGSSKSKKDTSKSQPSKKQPKSRVPKKRDRSCQKSQDAKDTFQCKICGKSLNQRCALLAHMKRHVSKKCYRCEFCNEEFKELKELKAHARKHTSDRPYTCSECNKCFKSQGTLKAHMLIHTGRLPYSCQICGKSFSQTSGLNVHKLTHTAEEERAKRENNSSEFTCDICGKAYKTKFRLTIHAKSHDSKRDMPCDFCDKKFQSGHDLAIHRRTHTKDKYACRLCGASFKSRSVYYFHTRTHPTERPHLCHTCGKSFTRSYDLTAHKRRHTESADKQLGPYGCEVCGKVYQMKNSLKIHMKIHQGIFDHPCDFCEKKFKCPAELRHHRRVHTLEKPYKCETCGRSFSRHSTLVNHRRTHSGERPYLCIVCGSTFKLSCTLKKHAKVHTREGPVKGKGARTRQTPALPQAAEMSATTLPDPAVSKAEITATLPATAAAPLPLPLQQQQQQQEQQQQQPLQPSEPQLQQLQLPQQPQPLPQSHQIIINHRREPSSTLLLTTPTLKQTVATLIQTDSATLLQHLERAGGSLQPQLHQQQQQQQQQQLQQQQHDIADLQNMDTIALPANILHMRDTNATTTLMDLRDTTGIAAVRTFLTTNELDMREVPRTLATAQLDNSRDASRNVMDMRAGPSSATTLQYNPNATFPSYYYYQ